MNSHRLPYRTVLSACACDHTLEIAAAVENANRSSRETIERLSRENAAQAIELERLRTENARHRRNGLLRLAADLRKPETLLDAAALSLARRSAARDLPGYERPRHWFEGNANGFSDEGSI
jgi:hypothetical protein